MSRRCLDWTSRDVGHGSPRTPLRAPALRSSLAVDMLPGA